MGEKLSEVGLEILYDEIMAEIHDIWMYNKQKGLIRQKEIINKINAHPEILRMRTRDWGYRTIGMQTAMFNLFYVTMRALQDGEACVLKNERNKNIYDTIKIYTNFRDQIVNSWQYERLVTKKEESLTSRKEPQYNDDDLFNEYEYADMDQYDSIVE